MKFYCDDELLGEIPDFMVEVMCYFEDRATAKKRYKMKVARQLEAHCRGYMEKFKKKWEGEITGKFKNDEEFVQAVLKQKHYQDFEGRMKNAQEEAKKLAESKIAEEKEVKEKQEKALKKSFKKNK